MKNNYTERKGAQVTILTCIKQKQNKEEKNKNQKKRQQQNMAKSG